MKTNSCYHSFHFSRTVSGIFIPGGWSDESGSTNYSLTTSLYIPSKKQFCELPNVPNDRLLEDISILINEPAVQETLCYLIDGLIERDWRLIL